MVVLGIPLSLDVPILDGPNDVGLVAFAKLDFNLIPLVRHGFETLNLNRIWLYVFEDNPRAIHVYEKVGFKREGLLRQDRFHEGHYWDTILMSILREEWDVDNHQAR